MTIRLGLQIPNFTYPDTPPRDIFGTVVAQAQAAERAGFDTVMVMDHFYQLPGIGPAENEMLEAYTALAALAMTTERVQLSALVTGNTYRNPALLAKTVTSLDVVSRGRAVLGIGAGWFEQEHLGYGFDFGTFGERFEKLDEALQIIRPMLRGDAPTFEGRHYRAHEALNNPRVRDDLPIMIGGSGERKTFRLAALFADHLNIICAPEELPQKLSAARQRCEEVDRDPATLATSWHASVVLGDDPADARARAEAGMTARGVDPSGIPPERVAAMTARLFLGTPDDVARGIQERVLAHGVQGLTVSIVADGHDPHVVEAVGRALAPLVG